MKRRVLQLTGSFHNGGSERQAAALAIGLKQAGEFEILLAALSLDGPLIQQVKDSGFIDIRSFPLTSFFNAGFLKQVRACSAFIKENGIDLVHTHDFYTNVFGMAAASLAGASAKIASKRETGGMRSKGQDIVEKIAFGRATRILANSQAVRDSLSERGVGDDRIEIIYNGLDLAAFDSANDVKTDLGIPSDHRVITLVANLRHEVKNVPMFLRAAQIVSRAIDDTSFVIAGEGELERGLRSLSEELGISNRTYFIGRCDDVPGLLNSSYACVLTSTAEGFANSIIEYMAAAKPVVATDVGGAAEAVEVGETGYLVDSDDAEAMARHLIELLNDEAMATEFGRKGRRVAKEKFSRAAQLENTSALYRKLLLNR